MKNVIKMLFVATVAMTFTFAYAQDNGAGKMGSKKAEKKEMKADKKMKKATKKADNKEMKKDNMGK